jgi:hypothetical protein
MSKRTHDYPETRKPRDTSYSEKYRVAQKYGLDHIFKVWKKQGMYKTAAELNTSPYVIRDIAQTQNWIRPAERVPIILAGVKAGKMDPAHYKTLDFSNVNLKSNNENNEETK